MLTHGAASYRGAPMLGVKSFIGHPACLPSSQSQHACTMDGDASPYWRHLGAAEAVRQEFALALGELLALIGLAENLQGSRSCMQCCDLHLIEAPRPWSPLSSAGRVCEEAQSSGMPALLLVLITAAPSKTPQCACRHSSMHSRPPLHPAQICLPGEPRTCEPRNMVSLRRCTRGMVAEASH
jgi:hypothetical protein